MPLSLLHLLKDVQSFALHLSLLKPEEPWSLTPLICPAPLHLSLLQGT